MHNKNKCHEGHAFDHADSSELILNCMVGPTSRHVGRQEKQQEQQQRYVSQISYAENVAEAYQRPAAQQPLSPHTQQRHKNNNNYALHGAFNATWTEHAQCSSCDAEAGSDHLLVTFDYGYSSDSIELHTAAELNQDVGESDYADDSDGEDVDVDEDEDEQEFEFEDSNAVEFMADALAGDGDEAGQAWFCAPQINHDAAQFQVHRMRHNIKDNEMSFLSTLIEYDVDEEIGYDAPVGIDCKALFRADRYVGEDEDEDEDDDYDEHEFYDSLEC